MRSARCNVSRALVQPRFGFVSVLIGLCDFAIFFLCCSPFVGRVERGGEGDICDAIALDRRKDRIGGRRHCDNGNPSRRNTSESAKSGAAVDSVFHLNASPVFTEHIKSCVVTSGSFRREQWLRTAPCIVPARMDAGKQEASHL